MEQVDNSLVCDNVPMAVKSSSVYVINLSKVNPADLTTDSVIYKSHACPNEFIEIQRDENNDLVSYKRLLSTIPSGNRRNVETFRLRRQYSTVSTKGYLLKRIITKFEDSSGMLAKYAIIRYAFRLNGKYVDKVEVNPFQKSHGNLKRSKETYYRTKPSVLEKMSKYGSYLRPKQIVSAIEKEAGGSFHFGSPSDIPRDRRQVFNKVRHLENRPKARNTGKTKTPDYTRLVNMLQTGDFVKDFSFHLNEGKQSTIPRVFASPSTHLRWINKFCSPKPPSTPLGIDMTYKCGPFYATFLVMQHPAFVSKENENHHPGVILAMMTSASKEQSDYEYLANQLSSAGIYSIRLINWLISILR